MIRERLILESLQKGTIAAVAASIVPTLPIKFLGRTFITPDDQKYIEAILIPNNGIGDFWASEKNYRGLFRLLLHWPTNNEGVYPVLDVAASIAGYFTKDRFLSNVTITEEPNLTGILEEGSELILPMSIRYQWFAVG